MRYFLNIVFPLCIIPAVYSQGVIIAAGQMVVKNGANVVIASNGNWTNNATAVCETGSWVRFTGNARQSILGSSYTTFSNVDVNNSHSDGVWVGRNIGINDNLNMTLGHFNLRDFITTFSSTASVTGGETNAKRIRATDAAVTEGLGTGYIITTRVNPSGDVANLGLSVNFTGGAVELRRGHLRQQGTGTFVGNYSVFRYYEFRNTTFAATSVTFNTCFTDELNGHNPAQLVFYQWLSTSGTMTPEYWSPIPDNITGQAVPIIRTLQGSTLSWSKVTLGSILLPLPVSLVSFYGDCKGESVNLFWQTTSEVNSYYFSVWRSNNGSDYSLVGNVYAAGYSSSLQNYYFNDDNPVSGIAYYRLTQTDNDMTTVTLQEISVICNEQNFPEDFTIFHGNGQFVVGVQGVPGKIYRLTFTNVIGQSFYTDKYMLDDKQMTLNLDDTHFAAGMYFVTLESMGFRITKQVVISENK